MDLVKIDDVHTQAAQASLHLGANHFGLEIWEELPLVVPRAATLGRDQRAGSHLSQSAPDHLLGMAQAVSGRGVDPFDAQIECSVNGGDGLAIILRAPREGPAAATYRPRPKADGRQLQFRPTQASCLHGSFAVPMGVFTVIRTFSFGFDST